MRPKALTATHAWLDKNHPGRSVCIIEPDHAASIRVAQKLGYRDFDSSDYKGDADADLLSVTAPNPKKG